MACGNTVVLHSGHEDRHERGVGFVLSRRAADALVEWNPVNDRIITARFVTRHTCATVIQIYAPMEASSDEAKNDFYELLQVTVEKAPRRDMEIVLGDFNAKLGGDRCGFENTIGPFVSSEELSNNDDNGDHNELCSISNTNGFIRNSGALQKENAK
ncbi:hypothetical protein TELCIR_24962 [Teladorsagia circumcincta]|uniref:Endonuclease/exonuclease/phosphatase domain-containing protein n=1 Tax=Teladorsagia circumcincta TaxID=45464 RepID=A0A2G9T6Z1_TELCI|nr:hypothetical protein TELCIR_24962 [Teladorsagia circumcincta]